MKTSAERTYSLEIRDGEREIVLIDSFSLKHGSVTFLFGESGIGKSLIAKSIFGLPVDPALTVHVNGQELGEYRHRHSVQEVIRSGFFVFQEPSTHLNPLMRLSEQLREGTLSYTDEKGILKELWRNASAAEIEELMSVFPKPYRPSGGEKQRILLAMALKKMDDHARNYSESRSPLFIFDEPTSNLDNDLRDQTLDLIFARFHTFPSTILFITHDYSIVSAVRKKWEILSPSIAWRELIRRDESVMLRSFSPERYSAWISGRPAKTEEKTGRGSPVMRIESRVEIFNRRLILKNEEAKPAAAMDVFSSTLHYLKAPSGTGKTTFAKASAGLLPAGQISIAFGDDEYTEKTPRSTWKKKLWGKKITMVFQHADEAINVRSTVRGVFTLLPLKETSDEKILQLLRELFDEADSRFLDRRVDSLSGGQRQKLNLLRCFALDTEALILDEPLNGLDFDSMCHVIDMIERKRKAGNGIVIISHHEEIFDTMVDKRNVYYLEAEKMEK